MSVREEEITQCPVCDHREDDPNLFKTTIYICNGCQEEFENEADAEACTTTMDCSGWEPETPEPQEDPEDDDDDIEEK